MAAQECSLNVQRLLELTEEMLALADDGDRDRDDGSCGILFGVLRDCGYRLRRLAQEERDRRIQAGRWGEDCARDSG